MKDVTAIVEVATAVSGAYDLNGFESVLAFGAVTTGYDASAVKISVSDDGTTFTELPAGSPAVVARFDGADGKTAKISYIGGSRYIKISGMTPTAVLLMNPLVAPVGATEAPETETAASGGNGGGGQQGGDTRSASRSIPSPAHEVA